MKKHNISHFLKSNSFYVLLFVGVIAIAVVTMIGVNATNKGNENLADLNSPIENSETNIGELTEDTTNIDNVVESESILANDNVIGDYTNDALLEYDNYDGTYAFDAEDSLNVADQSQTEESANTKTVDEGMPTEIEESEDLAEDTVSVMQPEATNNSLSFSDTSNMTWPVKGNVILNYSMDKTVHFATLGEWKCNPAIIISSGTGTDVVAATKGIVSSVAYNEETGTTVTMDVGNDYQVVYGQLENVTCKVGDVVQKNSKIATIAAPTSYYTVEGSNLYLQVLNQGEPINPMLFLTAEE